MKWDTTKFGTRPTETHAGFFGGLATRLGTLDGETTSFYIGDENRVCQEQTDELRAQEDIFSTLAQGFGSPGMGCTTITFSNN
jgi:hypothetical protein